MSKSFWWYITFPLKLAIHASGVATGDGSWRLRSYERRLIDEAATTLTIDQRAILDRQLAGWFYIQRIHSDQMNDIYFYFPEQLPVLDTPADAYEVALIELVDGRKKLLCSVETYGGLIRALRFKKNPHPLIDGAFVTAVRRTGSKSDDSWVRAIDREEHGDE